MAVALKVGADPEMFVYKRKDGFVSPHEFFPGDKENPFPVAHGALQVDGFSAEFNILPAETEEQFVNNLQSVMQSAALYLPKDHFFAKLPSANFRKSYLDTLPDSLKVMGCSPDYNAWEEGTENPPPMVVDPTLRAAGGHIHLGWGEGFIEQDMTYASQVVNLVKQLDCSVGALVMTWDNDNKRRELYGKAGAFRFKPYGLEYRTPSNAWIRSEGQMRTVYQRVQKSFKDFLEGNLYYEKFPEIQEVINTGDRKKAGEIAYAVFQ